FYFCDPDGHTLELIHFPPGKGDPRWQHANGRLFLGIDHTAIGVRDTAASLAFYRDRLGLAVVGESLNVGPQQERPPRAPGPRRRLTGLGAPAGPPGIELLEYQAPRDGRRLPAAPRPNDLVHWHTILSVGAVDATAKARVLSDPDGHTLQLVEP